MEYDRLRVDEYLKRIETNRPTNGSTEEYLNQLHIGHLTHIPFETFDLVDFKTLNISEDYIFNRLVRQQRGGVCFQMNGLFSFILKMLNFEVNLIPCSVYDDQRGHFHDRYSHVAVYVISNNDTKFLCDVGFPRNFLTPLFFRTDCIQFATNGFFRLTKADNNTNYILERGFLNEDYNSSLSISSSPRTQIVDIKSECIKWIITYRFPVDFLERSIKLSYFNQMCSFICHSPDVILNHCTICCIHTYKPVTGVYGILGKNYYEWMIENAREIRRRYPLADNDDEFKKFLKEKFNLTIDRKIELVD